MTADGVIYPLAPIYDVAIIEARHMISSAPIRELVPAISPALDVAPEAEALRYRVWEVNEDAECREAGLAGAQEARRGDCLVIQRAA
jgi:hypothetical protein